MTNDLDAWALTAHVRESIIYFVVPRWKVRSVEAPYPYIKIRINCNCGRWPWWASLPMWLVDHTGLTNPTEGYPTLLANLKRSIVEKIDSNILCGRYGPCGPAQWHNLSRVAVLPWSFAADKWSTQKRRIVRWFCNEKWIHLKLLDKTTTNFTGHT